MTAVDAAAGRADVLDAIVASTRRTLAWRREQCPEDVLERRAADARPRGEMFLDALAQPDRVNVIAECKRRSPLKGVLKTDYDPVTIAAGYSAAGAAAVSVLTEPAFFDGALPHLAAVRAAVALPLLRKDFIVDRYQLLEARVSGADAVLLIVACLDDRTLGHLHGDAASLGLGVLVEAHDERELARAVDCGARAIGINNRNLRHQDVALGVSHALIDRIPGSCIAVAESGIRTGREIADLRRAGFDAFLVGERLMAHADPGAALAALRGDAEAILRKEAGS